MKHLTTEKIQEFLDRGLTPKEEAQVQEHLSVCPHCQAEAESWNLLFAELGSLPELDPGPGFLEHTLEQVPVREPVFAGLRERLAARKARYLDDAHVPPGAIQDYLEGMLAPQPTGRLEAHLDSCPTCRREVRDCERLLGSFRSLGHLVPSAGFAERVMAQVRVPAPAPVGPWTAGSRRVLAWARSLLPQTRRGWAITGGVASAPTIIIGALVFLVFSHPQLTVGAFTSYAAWKASVLFQSIASALTGGLVESATLFRAYSVFEPIAQSPVLLGVGGLVFSLLSATALWILYRNLFVTPSDDRYARARV